MNQNVCRRRHVMETDVVLSEHEQIAFRAVLELKEVLPIASSIFLKLVFDLEELEHWAFEDREAREACQKKFVTLGVVKVKQPGGD